MKNDTLLTVGLIAGGGYLLYRLTNQVQQTGQAIADTASQAGSSIGEVLGGVSSPFGFVDQFFSEATKNLQAWPSVWGNGEQKIIVDVVQPRSQSEGYEFEKSQIRQELEQGKISQQEADKGLFMLSMLQVGVGTPGDSYNTIMDKYLANKPKADLAIQYQTGQISLKDTLAQLRDPAGKTGNTQATYSPSFTGNELAIVSAASTPEGKIDMDSFKSEFKKAIDTEVNNIKKSSSKKTGSAYIKEQEKQGRKVKKIGQGGIVRKNAMWYK
jgi:hypothetical protein